MTSAFNWAGIKPIFWIAHSTFLLSLEVFLLAHFHDYCKKRTLDMELWNNFQFYCNIICTFITILISAFKGNITKNVYNNQVIYCFPIIIIIMTLTETQQGFKLCSLWGI